MPLIKPLYLGCSSLPLEGLANLMEMMTERDYQAHPMQTHYRNSESKCEDHRVLASNIFASLSSFLSWLEGVVFVYMAPVKELMTKLSDSSRFTWGTECRIGFKNSSGIQTDKGWWLWRNCKSIKKLQLKSCQSVGDGESFSSLMGGFVEIDSEFCFIEFHVGL
ncbi:hypothetical protein V6N13_107214 [Hibiscus sabdariffa]|uniref:Uncharacterized protein n=2 Tax=Hibiscus sabdariffa TaxID=183260 RepID=A0ABR2SPK8_9ROSI